MSVGKTRAGSEAGWTPAEGQGPLAGKAFIVTGATGGIGWVTARELARRGAAVWIGCRTLAKGEAAARAIADALVGEDRLPPLELAPFAADLADLASVRAAAAGFLATGRPLHGLINNAGIAGTRGLTRDGFELTFGVNHLAPFLLTRLLAPCLNAGAPARVVNVSSAIHRKVSKLDDADFEALRRPTATRTGLHEYAVSKLANILFTRALARRWGGTGVTSYALHPGAVATDIWRRVPGPLRWLLKLFMLSSERGAATTLHCATVPALAGVSGRYYEDQREVAASPLAEDGALADRLWAVSSRWCGLADG